MRLWQLVLTAVPVTILSIGGLMWGIPAYKVYGAQQEGKAILAKAEYSRLAQIEDAKAKLQAAEYLNKAALVIQNNLNEPYLRYLEIQMKEEVGGKNDAAVYFFGPGVPAPVVPVKPSKP